LVVDGVIGVIVMILWVVMGLVVANPPNGSKWKSC